jgi:hypothetical protein
VQAHQTLFDSVADNLLQNALAKRAAGADICIPGGLGIGLYQAARHAEKNGYVLALTENRDGSVCFALALAGG